MARRTKRPAISDGYDKYLWGVLLFVVVLVATVYLLTHLRLLG